MNREGKEKKGESEIKYILYNRELKVRLTICSLLSVSCFCLFGHCFRFPFVSEIEKLTNSGRDKKYMTRNIIVNKTVHKEAKRQKQKQGKQETKIPILRTHPDRETRSILFCFWSRSLVLFAICAYVYAMDLEYRAVSF